jgi:hypothetical protein
MESIYYVLSWLCHRRCNHCYDARFRPYVRDEKDAVVNEALASHAAIVANLPDRMTYRETEDGPELPGRVILSGGEVLLDAIREPLLYPVMDLLRAKYAEQGGLRVVVQTTGDLVTKRLLTSCANMVSGKSRSRGWTISMSAMKVRNAYRWLKNLSRCSMRQASSQPDVVMMAPMHAAP